MRYFTKSFIVFLIAILCLFGCGQDSIETTLHSLSNPSVDVVVTDVPPDVQAMLWGDSEAHRAYYTRYVNAGGIAIVGSRFVDDEIFSMAHNIVLLMTAKRPEIREKLSQYGDYQVLVNGRYEDSDDLPGIIRDTAGWCAANYCVSFYWDHPYPPGYSRATRNSGILEVFVHEFAHAIHHTNPTFDDRLTVAYETALEKGTWAGLYAETDPGEYWAEGVTWWYYYVTDLPIPRHNPQKGPIFETYEAFAERDPLLYALLSEWFYKDSFRDKGY